MNQTLKGFIVKELTQTLRDPKMRVVLFLIPMFQMMVFGLAISTEVKNIRLTTVSSPNDVLTQEVARKAYASGWFVPVNVHGVDPYELLRSNQTDAVLIAPGEGASRAQGRGKPSMQLLIDATNVIRAQSVENYLRGVITQVTADRGLTFSPQAVSFDIRVLYNPGMESAMFMVPGVMSLIVCVVTILLTSMSMAREREMGTFEMIISAPVTRTEVLLGKTVPFILLGIVNILLILGVAVFAFGVPMRGGIAEFGAAALVFVITTVSIGTLISTFSANQQQAMMGGFIFLFAATLLSGILFPLDNMPVPLLALSYMNPLRYFVILLRNIMLKGGEPAVIWSNVSALAAIGIASLSLAFARFRATLQ